MTKPSLTSYQKGVLGEWLSCCYLRICGYRIIKKRFRSAFAETDIIARKRDVIVFVEVKWRKQRDELYEAISSMQKQRLIRNARHYMATSPYYDRYQCRFDVIFLQPLCYLKHIKHAWDEY